MPASRGQSILRAIGIAAVSGVLETGCMQSPSVNVLGAYFPDWLFCMVTGVVLTVVVYLVLARLPGGHRFGPPAVVYPTLVILLALVAWLIFFQQ